MFSCIKEAYNLPEFILFPACSFPSSSFPFICDPILQFVRYQFGFNMFALFYYVFTLLLSFFIDFSIAAKATRFHFPAAMYGTWTLGTTAPPSLFQSYGGISQWPISTQSDNVIRIGYDCPDGLLQYYLQHPPSKITYIYEIDMDSNLVNKARNNYFGEKYREYKKIYPAPPYGRDPNPYKLDKAVHNAMEFTGQVYVPWTLIPGWTILDPKTQQMTWARNKLYKNPNRILGILGRKNDWVPTWMEEEKDC